MDIQDIYSDITKSVGDFVRNNPDGVVIIRGATATGKTKLSLLLAQDFPVEIIGADSRQIFRGMNIGTDKISMSVRQTIPHHQIDIISPDQHYTAGQWKQDTESLITTIHQNKRIPLIVGGTGLYIDTIYKNFSMPEVKPDYDLRKKLEQEEEKTPGILRQQLYAIDPEEANKHHPHSLRFIIRALEIYHTTGKTKTASFIPQTPQWPLLMVGLRREKDDTNQRINKRIHEMFDEGLISEVQGLLHMGYSADLQSMQGIGYKEVVEYLQGNIDKDTCEELIKKNTHYLAKKQRTWFRRYIADSKQPQDNVTHCIYYLS